MVWYLSWNINGISSVWIVKGDQDWKDGCFNATCTSHPMMSCFPKFLQNIKGFLVWCPSPVHVGWCCTAYPRCVLIVTVNLSLVYVSFFRSMVQVCNSSATNCTGSGTDEEMPRTDLRRLLVIFFELQWFSRYGEDFLGDVGRSKNVLCFFTPQGRVQIISLDLSAVRLCTISPNFYQTLLLARQSSPSGQYAVRTSHQVNFTLRPKSAEDLLLNG